MNEKIFKVSYVITLSVSGERFLRAEDGDKVASDFDKLVDHLPEFFVDDEQLASMIARGFGGWGIEVDCVEEIDGNG